jgi:hypothetical protein
VPVRVLFRWPYKAPRGNVKLLLPRRDSCRGYADSPISRGCWQLLRTPVLKPTTSVAPIARLPTQQPAPLFSNGMHSLAHDFPSSTLTFRARVLAVLQEKPIFASQVLAGEPRAVSVFVSLFSGLRCSSIFLQESDRRNTTVSPRTISGLSLVSPHTTKWVSAILGSTVRHASKPFGRDNEAASSGITRRNATLATGRSNPSSKQVLGLINTARRS